MHFNALPWSGFIRQPPSPTAISGILLGYDGFQLALGAVKRSLRNALGLRGFFNLGLGDGAAGQDRAGGPKFHQLASLADNAARRSGLCLERPEYGAIPAVGADRELDLAHLAAGMAELPHARASGRNGGGVLLGASRARCWTDTPIGCIIRNAQILANSA